MDTDNSKTGQPNPAAVINKAEEAQLAGDKTTALRHWQEAYERFPNRPRVYQGLSDVLCDLGHLQEADAVLGEGLKRFSDNIGLAIRYAEVKHSRGDFNAALACWQDLQSRFSDRPPVLARVGLALSSMGRFDEADELLSEATAKYAKNESIAIAYATSAQRRGDPAEALKRWLAVRERFPEQAEAQAGIEIAQRELSTLEEARRLIAASRPAIEGAEPEKNPAAPPRVAVPPAGQNEIKASPIMPSVASSLIASGINDLPRDANGGEDKAEANRPDQDGKAQRPADMSSSILRVWGHAGQPKAMSYTRRASIRPALSEGIVQRVTRVIRGLFGRQ